MEDKHRHLDPPRYPEVINPIEQGMKQMFAVTTKKIMIDITKLLTKEVKK
jgi:hypothetical protein